MNQTTEIAQNTPEQFVSLIREGIDKWKQAGECLVVMLDHNPNIRRRLLDEYSFLSPSILSKLEEVGRGNLLPELLMSDSYQFRKARELPVSEQRKAVDGCIPMVITKGDGFDVLEVDFKGLSSDQAQQVFDKDHIRSEQEQRLYLEQRKSASKKLSRDWEIQDGVIVFHRGARLSIQQLSGILQEVAASASR